MTYFKRIGSQMVRAIQGENGKWTTLPWSHNILYPLSKEHDSAFQAIVSLLCAGICQAIVSEEGLGGGTGTCFPDEWIELEALRKSGILGSDWGQIKDEK